MSTRQVAIQLNISNPALLGVWFRVYQTYGTLGLSPKPKGRPPMKLTPSKQTNKPDHDKTNEELLEEVQDLRMELDILKKWLALDHNKAPNKPPKTK
ncbi:MAG: hypothetical protein Q4G13_01505 [Moraxella sp.]|nr:hypothetical protein [Moraxella sp.]